MSCIVPSDDFYSVVMSCVMMKTCSVLLLWAISLEYNHDFLHRTVWNAPRAKVVYVPSTAEQIEF